MLRGLKGSQWEFGDDWVVFTDLIMFEEEIRVVWLSEQSKRCEVYVPG